MHLIGEGESDLWNIKVEEQKAQHSTAEKEQMCLLMDVCFVRGETFV